MLFDAPRIRAVARGLRRHRAVERRRSTPSWSSKSGARLLARPAVASLKRDLLPLCDLVTPNLPEAAALVGASASRPPRDRRVAAGAIADLGARAVLIKGGHGRGGEVRDLYFDGRFFTEFVAPRIRTRATHGTGCTLSSAIAANLALGKPLEEAILSAIQYLRAALARGIFPGPRVRRARPLPAPALGLSPAPATAT